MIAQKDQAGREGAAGRTISKAGSDMGPRSSSAGAPWASPARVDRPAVMGDTLGATMHRILTALALVLLAAPAQAGLTICNKTAHSAKTALGRFNGTQWMSEGWWSIPGRSLHRRHLRAARRPLLLPLCDGWRPGKLGRRTRFLRQRSRRLQDRRPRGLRRPRFRPQGLLRGGYRAENRLHPIAFGLSHAPHPQDQDSRHARARLAPRRNSSKRCSKPAPTCSASI